MSMWEVWQRILITTEVTERYETCLQDTNSLFYIACTYGRNIYIYICVFVCVPIKMCMFIICLLFHIIIRYLPIRVYKDEIWVSTDDHGLGY